MTSESKPNTRSKKKFDYINYLQFIGTAFTLYLALIWAKVCNFPSFLPSSMEVEPWTIIIGIITALPSFFRRDKMEEAAPHPNPTIIVQPVVSNHPNLAISQSKQIETNSESDSPIFLSQTRHAPLAASKVLGRQADLDAIEK
ncbi:MAG: hypothetical protein IT258_22075, partial [Saprospiraceae bacterium]|nr:hypothetical protein [Saprospiraceae bacterium]